MLSVTPAGPEPAVIGAALLNTPRDAGNAASSW